MRCFVVSTLLLTAGCLKDPSTANTGTPGGNGTPGIDGGGIDVGPPYVDIDGGTVVGTAGVVLTNEAATLVVPAGALAMPHQLAVYAITEAPALPEGWTPLSAFVEVAPVGLSLTKPATLALRYAPASASAVVLTTGSNATWAPAASASAAAGVASVDVSQLARYVVAHPPIGDGGVADGGVADGAVIDAAVDVSVSGAP